MNSAKIPAELRQRKQWIGYKPVPQINAKPRKIPINPRTGDAAKVNDPSSWTAIKDAITGMARFDYPYIGFVFTESDPYVGVDQDNVINPDTGEIEPTALEIAERLNTYSETSCSGTGLHHIAIGKLNGNGGRKKDGLEIYDHSRGFIVTADTLPDFPPTIEDRQKELDALINEYFKQQSNITNGRHNRIRNTILKMLHSGVSKDDVFIKAWQLAKSLNTSGKRVITEEEVAALVDWCLTRVPKNDMRINASNQDLPQISKQALDALVAANNPPKLFLSGGFPVRVERSEDKPVVRPLTIDVARHEIARSADWFKVVRRKKGESDTFEDVAAKPPVDVVRDVLAFPNLPFPMLERIVHAPVFAADGSIGIVPGYNPKNRTYYAPAARLKLTDISQSPSKVEIQKAKALIKEMIQDFPFTGEAERTHAIALMLLPFARDLINGPTPLHLFEKPSPGTGATLLAEVLAFPSIGQEVPKLTEASNDEEWGKKLTAKFRQLPVHICIDNIFRPLVSPALSAALTSTVWEERILGLSETAVVPIRCTWSATANNPTLSDELARRSIRIRLDAECEQPWTRSEFRIPALFSWAMQHHSELVHAALTLIQAWIAAGRPKGSTRLGMFESWAEVMGGIFEVVKIPAFLANLGEFYEQSDSTGDVWRRLIEIWWKKFDDKNVGVSKLFGIVESNSLGFDLGQGGDRSQKIRFGKMLRSVRDRQFSGYRITEGEQKQGAQQWHLTRLGPTK